MLLAGDRILQQCERLRSLWEIVRLPNKLSPIQTMIRSHLSDSVCLTQQPLHSLFILDDCTAPKTACQIGKTVRVGRRKNEVAFKAF